MVTYDIDKSKYTYSFRNTQDRDDCLVEVKRRLEKLAKFGDSAYTWGDFIKPDPYLTDDQMHVYIETCEEFGGRIW